MKPFLLLLFLQVQDLNAPVCLQAGRDFLITCGAIDLIIAIACVVLQRVWSRRLVNFATALVVPLVIAFLSSTLLVALNPFKTEIYLDCISNVDFSRYIFLANVANISKGLVLGGLVCVALYLLILVILGVVNKLRG